MVLTLLHMSPLLKNSQELYCHYCEKVAIQYLQVTHSQADGTEK